MRVVKVTKLEEKYRQWDISTTTETFYVKANDTWLLIHNSPSVVFGTHPETGKFFVASKSAFNKDPKINYTEEDIDRNHGHAPGLAAKLKQLLNHGPKLGVKGVVQGDFLFDQTDKTESDNKVSFKPNTIRYSAPTDSAHGKKVAAAKIGVALHTRYENGKAVLDPNIEHKEHKDVYVMPVSVDQSKMEFNHDTIRKHVSESGRLMKQIPKHGWEAITHDKIVPHVKTYINSEVRKGNSNYTTNGLLEHIKSKYQKEIDKVSSNKSKETKSAQRDELMNHVHQNREHFENAFRIQEHITHAKHHIIDKLNQNQDFEHSYDDGSKANPEGYVMIGHHGPLKLVNRQEFSRNNFMMSQNR